MFTKEFLLDLLERSAWTFIQTFAATVIVAGAFDLPSLSAAAVAAGLAVLKGLVASQIGNKGSASTLPKSVDPNQ